MTSAAKSRLTDAAIQALVEARHDDPFAVLGPHEAPGGVVIRALVPGAARLEVVEEATGAVVGELMQPTRGGPVRGRARRTGRPGSATPCAPTTRAAAGTSTTPTAIRPCWARWTTT